MTNYSKIFKFIISYVAFAICSAFGFLSKIPDHNQADLIAETSFDHSIETVHSFSLFMHRDSLFFLSIKIRYWTTILKF